MPAIPKQEILEMLNRATNATPGPWAVSEVSTLEDGVVSRGIKVADGRGINKGESFELFSIPDATFIAHARTDLERLATAYLELLANQAAIEQRYAKKWKGRSK